MRVLIKTVSITIVFFVIITHVSCENKTKGNANNKQVEAYNNRNDIYKIVDSVNSLSDKFSNKNIYIMGNLYKNKILQKMLISDAYIEVDDYFLDLFFKENERFYAYLFELDDSVILYNIKRDIFQHFDLSKDYINNFNFYKDSIYNNHLKNNIDKKSIVDEVFGYNNPATSSPKSKVK